MTVAKTWILLALAGSALTPFTAAYAADADASGGNTAVEEVVVTAQRRDERIVDVPITITSISAQKMDQQSIHTVKDIFRLTPAVTVTHNGAWTEPAIRGVNSRVGENSVAVYIDGLYNPSKVSIDADFNNVARVDVLKGPQGTLFGRNATGGAIMITTKDPSHDPHFSVSGGVEERNGRSGNFYGTTGLSDTVAVDLALTARGSDGWLVKGHDPVSSVGVPVGTPLNKQWQYGERAKLLWTPAEGFRLTLTAEHGGSYDTTGLLRTPFNHQLVQPAAPSTRNTIYSTYNADNRAFWGVGSAKAEYTLGDYKFSSLTGFRNETNHLSADTDTRDAPTSSASWFSTDKTFSQEFNISHKGERVEWVGGLFYYDNDFVKKYISANLRAEQITKSFAPYLDATINVTDNLSVIVGGRYSYEQRDFHYQRPIAAPTTVAFLNSKTWTDFSPRAVVRYKFDENSNVYASYSKGFKSGLYNTDAVGLTAGSQLAAQALNPEKLQAFEVGYKISRPRWAASLAAYHYKWTNIQVSRYTGTTTIFQNAAAATIYGLEGSASWNVTDNLTLSLAGAYTHGRYDSFKDLSVNLPTVPADPNSPNSVTALQDVSGDRILRAPDWSGNFNVNYSKTTSVGEFIFFGSVYYSSDFSTATVREDPITGEPSRISEAHTLVTASLAWKPTENWQVQIYGRNLFDAVYLQDADANIFGENGVWGEPRTVGVKLSYSY
ncbi:MAG: TonB-dependent receptor [Caulobacter sp.]|nr:TonB-dependent receptor [Caulobacter sp.]